MARHTSSQQNISRAAKKYSANNGLEQLNKETEQPANPHLRHIISILEILNDEKKFNDFTFKNEEVLYKKFFGNSTKTSFSSQQRRILLLKELASEISAYERNLGSVDPKSKNKTSNGSQLDSGMILSINTCLAKQIKIAETLPAKDIEKLLDYKADYASSILSDLRSVLTEENAQSLVQLIQKSNNTKFQYRMMVKAVTLSYGKQPKPCDDIFKKAFVNINNNYVLNRIARWDVLNSKDLENSPIRVQYHYFFIRNGEEKAKIFLNDYIKDLDKKEYGPILPVLKKLRGLNSCSKKIAIIDSYRKEVIDSNKDVAEVINDKTSSLYKALNTHRYFNFSFFTKDSDKTRTLKSVEKALASRQSPK